MIFISVLILGRTWSDFNVKCLISSWTASSPIAIPVPQRGLKTAITAIRFAIHPAARNYRVLLVYLKP